MSHVPQHGTPQSPEASGILREPWDRLLAMLGVILVAAALGRIGAALARQELTFALLLVPVSLSAWWFSFAATVVVALCGAATYWLFAPRGEGELALLSFMAFVLNWLLLCGYGWLVARVRTSQQRVTEVSHTDPLTGQNNRSGFLESLQAEIDRSRRRGYGLAVAFLDCDNFKAWNDTRGHKAGDELLQEVAHLLARTTRSYDVVARLGGDEFAVLLPDIPLDHVTRTLDRLMQSLRDLAVSREWPVSFSMGAIACERPEGTATEVLDQADQLMYEAKRAGKDQLVVRLERLPGERAFPHAPIRLGPR